MAYKLVCIHPFGTIKKGDEITDQAEVEKHLGDRGHHFVKVAVPDDGSPAGEKDAGK